MVDLLKFLKGIPIFKDLTEGEVKQLVDETQVVHKHPPEQIIRQGDQGDSVFIIISGICEVTMVGDQGQKHGQRRFHP